MVVSRGCSSSICSQDAQGVDVCDAVNNQDTCVKCCSSGANCNIFALTLSGVDKLNSVSMTFMLIAMIVPIILSRLMISGACLLAAGIVLVLQIRIPSEPFGLGTKLTQREEGGDELIIMLESAAWLCVAVGVLLALIGFSGCTGSFGRVKRDYKVLGKVFLITFMFLVLLVLMMTLGLSISTILFQDTLKQKLKIELAGTMEAYRGERSSHPSSVFWNYLQLKLECCGADSADDWMRTESWPRLKQHENQSWPYVCCKWEGRSDVTLRNLDSGGVPRPRYTEWEQCYQLDTTSKSRYVRGCADALEEMIVNNFSTMSIVVASIIFFCLLFILMAIVLCRHQDYYSMHFLDS
ncbi:tetraspanin-18-like [Convolutriloba macropyga]|uniref:tetraspanin-18-like n=1 Tax=Convolutriloba macropyga TaxID=536237 RepID=UPI003F525127